MGCVTRVSELRTFGRLKCQLECDTCHPSDWATCSLLIFLHVALLSSMDGGAPDGHNGCVAPDCEVQILDTSKEMVHDGMGGRNP
jgi:hypothetical protein